MNVTTNITIGDFLIESEIWEYSRERFGLLKDCGELTLMEAYSQTEEYIVENADTLTVDTLDQLMVEAGSTADKLVGYLSSSPNVAAKLAEKKYGVGTQVFSLLQTISRANVAFWNGATTRFTGSRKDKIVALNTEAGNLLESVVKLGTEKLKIPASSDTKVSGIELVKGIFDSDTTDIRKFNDALKEYLSDADYKALKRNEGWLAPKLSIQQLKVVSTIVDLMTETANVVENINELQSPLEIVKDIDVLSAKIAGIKADSTISFINADTLQRTCKTLKSADDKLNDNIKSFIKDAKTSSAQVSYGAIFTALASLITQLRLATKTAIKGTKAVMDQIDTAIEYQKQILSQIREKTKK
ncbi:hypothetical protein FACS1894219_08270 [Clostridia bacterium]|nr:hypothetical protein FACS1894219_08270 [Clostridia bacterium]